MAFATKKRAELAKMIGGSIIFLSAITQQSQYDAAKSRMDEITQAAHDQSLIDKSALINQTSLYVLSGNVDVPQRDHLREVHAGQVAAKLAMSIVPLIQVVEGMDQTTKDGDLALVRAEARKVNDVITLSNFMMTYSVISKRYSILYERQLVEIRNQQSRWRDIYFKLYLLGGFILLISSVMEWLLAEPAKPKQKAPPAAA